MSRILFTGANLQDRDNRQAILKGGAFVKNSPGATA